MAWNSHPDIDEIIRAPGYLFVNPTGTATEADWGTKLGYTEDGIRIKIAYNTTLLDVEDTGLDWKYKVFTGCNVKVMVLLKNWNTVALKQLMPGMSSTTKIIIRNSIKTGTLLNSATYTDKILFVPDDQTNNPACILRKASANISADIELHRSKDTKFPIAWDGFGDTSVFWFGPFSELIV